MTVPSATWETAPELGMLESSTPVSLADFPESTVTSDDGPPYHSAWLKFTPPTTMTISVDTLATTVAGDVTAYADTALALYEGPVVDIFDFPEFNNNATDGAGRSRIDPIEVTGGVTYYIRAGAFTAGLTDIDGLVVTLTSYTWSDWVQPPNIVRTRGAFPPSDGVTPVHRSFRSSPIAPVTSSTFDQGIVNALVAAASSSDPGVLNTSTTSETSLSPFVSAGGTFRANLGRAQDDWLPVTYSIQNTPGGIVWTSEQEALVARPFTDVGPTDLTPFLPPEAIDIEVSGSYGTPEKLWLVWSCSESTVDATSSAPPSERVLSGTFSFPLSHDETLIVDTPGTGMNIGQIASGLFELPLPSEYVTATTDPGSEKFSARLNFSTMTLARPGFYVAPGESGGATSSDIRFSYNLALRTELRPPLIRYLIPGIPTPVTRRVPRPLRQHPRSDGLAMSSARRQDANRSMQASLRRGGGTYF